MTLESFVRCTAVCAVVAGLLIAPLNAEAAKREKITTASVKVPADTPVVGLFDGMKSGKLEVQFIPKSAKGANILIKNKTDKPVRIALPGAFAGVPIHRQFGGGGLGGGGGGLGGGGLGGGGLGGGGGGQGVGGGLGGGGGGLGGGGGGFGGGGLGGGGGGGFFNVAPDKLGKIEVTTLCLEHGKPDPTPNMKYTIAPIETLTKKPEVIELCKLMASGKISQNIAQATAWHLTDDMSWAELANKDRIKLRSGYTEKFFSPRELGFAMRLTQEVQRRAAAAAKHYEKAGKHNSLSQSDAEQ